MPNSEDFDGSASRESWYVAHLAWGPREIQKVHEPMLLLSLHSAGRFSFISIILTNQKG